MKDVINTDDNFRHLGRIEVDVLNACTGTELRMIENEEVLDVCEAIQTLNERAANERQIKVTLEHIKSLMESMRWSAEQTMDNMKVPEDDRKLLMPFL